MKRIYILVAIFTVIIFSACNSSKSIRVDEHISLDSLMTLVYELSSPKYQGRLSGTYGYNLASDLVAKKFNAFGLKPLGENNYFQHFNIETNEIDTPTFLNLITQKNEIINYELGPDFVCRGFTGSGHYTAPVAFCGFGVSQPADGYDDYAKIDVKGKIVMIFKYNPSWSINGNSLKQSYVREKAINAKKHGAVAMMIVSDPRQEPVKLPGGSVMCGPGEQPVDFPQIHIDIHVANEFLKGSGYSIEELHNLLDTKKKPLSINLKTKAEIKVTARYQAQAKTQNIIGLYEGIDANLKNEYVLVTGHLDHVGAQGSGKIYFPGANDNASGSVAVIEVARAFSKSKPKTARSVIFIAFASEEHGIDGATFAANNFPVPLDKIQAVINLDCIAHGDSLQIGNGNGSPMLYDFILKQDKSMNKICVLPTWGGGGADDRPFFQLGVPTTHWVTTNSYTHLHLQTDKPETLNPKLYTNVVKLAANVVQGIANSDYNREKIAQ